MAAGIDLATLVLTREQVAACAGAADYIRAVESAFRALAAGEVQSLPVGHVPGQGGTFHIKSASSGPVGGRVVIKINGNYPGNPRERSLPTIQGCIVLCDRANGRLLAVMDTIEITAQRTAAASAVAARHLARRDASTIAFVGCGIQARYHLESLLALATFPIRSVRCFDSDDSQAVRLSALAETHGLGAVVAASVREACHGADIVITTTPSRTPILGPEDVRPGTFIAAVGADNPFKCEIAPELMARARVVTDITTQSVAMGDLRAAIAAGVMREGDVHAELAEIVCATRPARTSDEEIFVFDSTGTAIEDLAAAVMVFERASADPGALRLALNG